MQGYGSLKWEFTELRTSANFLDLTLSFKLNGTFKTKLFEKELNLYLYIPPHSSHPPGALHGLITDMTKQIYRLTTDAADQQSSVINLFNRLLVRGHEASDILPMSKTALVTATKPLPAPVITTSIFDTAPLLFFHLPFHPRDVPSSKVIQAAFYSTIVYPRNEPPLSNRRNFENCNFRSDHLLLSSPITDLVIFRMFYFPADSRKARTNQCPHFFLPCHRSPLVPNFSIAYHDFKIMAGQNFVFPKILIHAYWVH